MTAAWMAAFAVVVAAECVFPAVSVAILSQLRWTCISTLLLWLTARMHSMTLYREPNAWSCSAAALAAGRILKDCFICGSRSGQRGVSQRRKQLSLAGQEQHVEHGRPPGKPTNAARATHDCSTVPPTCPASQKPATGTTLDAASAAQPGSPSEAEPGVLPQLEAAAALDSLHAGEEAGTHTMLATAALPNGHSESGLAAPSLQPSGPIEAGSVAVHPTTALTTETAPELKQQSAAAVCQAPGVLVVELPLKQQLRLHVLKVVLWAVLEGVYLMTIIRQVTICGPSSDSCKSAGWWMRTSCISRVFAIVMWGMPKVQAWL